MSERSGVQWIRIDAMCKRYGDVTAQTIREWVKSGKLPEPMPMGALDLWSMEECDAYDERNREAAKAKRELRAKSRAQSLNAANAARKLINENKQRARIERAAGAGDAPPLPHGVTDQPPPPAPASSASSSKRSRRGKAETTS